MYTLSLSGGDLPHLLYHESTYVAARLGISATAIETMSAVAGKVEHGTRIEFYTDDFNLVRTAFEHLRDAMGITCAWLLTDSYAGCILKYAPPSAPFPSDPNAPGGPSTTSGEM